MQRPVLLIRARDLQLVTALLVDLAQKHVEDFESLWRSSLQAFAQEDKYWDWLFKKRLSLSNENFESYALECDGKTQGLMTVETQRHRSQVLPGERIVYIVALATAPWNRRSIRQPPEFKAVGTALLLYARQRSVELGYAGRVGLHALPEAERFYERQNMANYGADEEQENLTYFEYPPLQRFL
ncbi:GNAT family N-acetyltransferase [Lusitaniella coriacea]|uniref:GNAT family N-acetyltransferase n=1 Tax=Lusitaniella coriacea TaxID=1983105 RepID=UPI003CF8CBBF